MWTVRRGIQAPSETVWRTLTALTEWSRWGPTVNRARLDHDEPLQLGSRGTLWTPLGVPLPFLITEFEPGRMWAWQVAGVQATKHGVERDGDGCRVWMSAPLWAPAYLPVLDLALRRIDRMVA